MELKINDFRDWLYDRIEEDDGVVVEDAKTFIRDIAPRVEHVSNPYELR